MNNLSNEDETITLKVVLFGEALEIGRSTRNELDKLFSSLPANNHDGEGGVQNSTKLAFELLRKEAKRQFPDIPLAEQIRRSIRLLTLVSIHSKARAVESTINDINQMTPEMMRDFIIYDYKKSVLEEVPTCPDSAKSCETCASHNQCPLEDDINRKKDVEDRE